MPLKDQNINFKVSVDSKGHWVVQDNMYYEALQIYGSSLVIVDVKNVFVNLKSNW